jgi:hypothetical protein
MLLHSTVKMEAVRSSETSKSNTLLGMKEQNVITCTFRLGYSIWTLNHSPEFKDCTVLDTNHAGQTLGLRATCGTPTCLIIFIYLHIVIVYFSVYNLMMATMRGRNM